MSAKRRKVVSKEGRYVYVEQYLGRDPTSIVMQYVGIEIPPNTFVVITLFSESKDQSLYDTVSRLGFDTIKSVLKFTFQHTKFCITTVHSNGLHCGLCFTQDCFDFQALLENLLARLCEGTRTNKLRFKVQENKSYQVQPWRIHPPIPLPFPEFTTLPPPSTLINWLFRLLIPFEEPNCFTLFFTYTWSLINLNQEEIIQRLLCYLQVEDLVDAQSMPSPEKLVKVLLKKYPRQVLWDAGCLTFM